MIVFDLLCGGGHRFEGWFSSADDFASQNQRGLLCCPSCGAQQVERVPSATRFNSGAEQPPAEMPAQPVAKKDEMAQAAMLFSRMLDEILSKSEDVGEAFPAEARRIHYEEAPARSIRGRASQKEHDELLEEGIPVARLPIPPSGAWN